MGLNDVSSFLASPFSLNQIWWHQVYLICHVPPMVESHTSISNISIPMAIFGTKITLSKVYGMEFVALLAFET
jgi:hypothetical protein